MLIATKKVHEMLDAEGDCNSETATQTATQRLPVYTHADRGYEAAFEHRTISLYYNLPVVAILSASEDQD